MAGEAGEGEGHINIQLFTAEECGGFGGGAFVYVRSSCTEQTQTDVIKFV